ncbi:hypothetical protein [Catelliglobosispora koreensis]|uniref:hypothetical protein n=1 Tax=Catelliglobosispora koreensis TaxID=129052 RepID=UPI0003628CCD
MFAGTITSDPVIDSAAAVQVWLSETANRFGAAGFAVILLAIVAVTALIWRAKRKDSENA